MRREVSYHSSTVVIISYQRLNSLKLPCKPLKEIYFRLPKLRCFFQNGGHSEDDANLPCRGKAEICK